MSFVFNTVFLMNVCVKMYVFMYVCVFTYFTMFLIIYQRFNASSLILFLFFQVYGLRTSSRAVNIFATIAGLIGLMKDFYKVIC